MFRRDKYKIGSYTLIRIYHECGSFVDIIPQLGAMVYQIGVADENGNIQSILACDTEKELTDNPWFRGRILFPFNDRIPSGTYTFEGCEYHLPINCEADQSAIHGLVYNREFTETQWVCTEDSGALSFLYSVDKKDYRGYPFSVDLKITYTLSAGDFSINFTVVNRDTKSLPFALGWHPYFTLGTPVDLNSMMCLSGSFVQIDKDLNPTGDIISVEATGYDFTEPRLLGDGELDIALTIPESGKTVLTGEKGSLKLTFDTELFSFIQLFTPPGRASIAIEPVTAATNSFNINGLGKIVLGPGEERSGSVKIRLMSNP